jgi:cellulose synthase/poly-beta-1,6-N-acetylglucosamine synthase-like glycosyltransferase
VHNLSSGAFLLFWFSLSVIFYTYLLYPIILFGVYSLVQIRSDLQYLAGPKNRRVDCPHPEQLPRVSLVIAAHNEEMHLADKIRNLRELSYPRSSLEIIIVSDGSEDRTNEILSSAADDQIRVIMLEKRKGKANALNIAVGHTTNEILVFSDAATLFAADTVEKLVRHFKDPSVGVACGFLKFKASSESRQTEGVYWKYETILRLMEARLGATLTASGAIYALRKACFRELSDDVVIDDFVVPMRARQRGYSVVFDPEAVGFDFAALSVHGEFTRRARLALGSFRATRELIQIPVNFMVRTAFFSHKLLRWTVPFLLIVLFVANTALLSLSVYSAFFGVQIFVYIWAILGFVFRDQMRKVRFGLLGYFWLAMNLAFLLGFWRFLLGRQGGPWQRVE